MTLSDEESLALHEQIKQRNAQKRAEAYARAREAADASGKEPFDLAKLGKLCALDALERMTPEERAKYLDYEYYVDYPDLRTLAEFAAILEERGRW